MSTANVIPFDAAEAVAEARAQEHAITQDGLARLFAKRHAVALRFCHSSSAWYAWDGARWQRDETERAFEFARVISREASEGREGKELKATRSVAFAAGVERFARSDEALATTAAGWDTDPWLLGTPGGTVDLHTGIIRPADPADRITKVTAVTPAATADCPTWTAFLDEATGGDRDLGRFLQQWCGYCLTGITQEHALVFVHGPGGNGKSVFVNAIAGALGDYAATSATETFAASMVDRHSTELAMLRGARLVAASETEQGRAWAETRIKQLTGGDPITARFMRQDNFTFRPEFKLTIIGNHAPVLHQVDDALRRRFNIVPFRHKPARPNPLLQDELRAEWPEILRWAIRGCLDWQAQGLIRPASVLDATADYFADQDVLGQWLIDTCDVRLGDERARETSAALYASWAAYAKAAGHKPESQKAFSAALQRRGLVPYRDKHSRGFRGVTLSR